MAALKRESIVQWSQTPISAEVGEEVVLMNLSRGRCYGLGPIGTDVWKHLSEPIQVGQLVQDLLQRYAADPVILEADVLEMLAQYADEGLIEVKNPEDSGKVSAR